MKEIYIIYKVTYLEKPIYSITCDIEPTLSENVKLLEKQEKT
jgi:hypothetical protein